MLKKRNANTETEAAVEEKEEAVAAAEATDAAEQAVQEKPSEETAPAEAVEEKAVATREETAIAEPMDMQIVSGIYLQNQAILDIVADLEFGSFPVIKASSGQFRCDGELLGTEIKFIAHAALNKDVLATGAPRNDEEAKEYFDVIYDGSDECAISGRDPEDRLQEAIDAGYEKASWKKYTDLIGTIVSCDDDEYEDETVIFQLSPTSRRAYAQLTKKVQMRAAMGKLSVDKPPVIVAIAFPDSWGGNDFTRFDFRFEK